MEPEGLLLCSQDPTIGPYLEPVEASPHPQNPFKIHLSIILPRYSKW